MSYRNPKIIDDKSGLIVSQAIEKASGTLAQGIAVFGAEVKRREEVLKKENERRNDIYIGLANEMSIDVYISSGGMIGATGSSFSFCKSNVASLLKRTKSFSMKVYLIWSICSKKPTAFI